MKPIAKYITLETIIENEETSSGMLLSADDSTKSRYYKGKVIAVGDEVETVKSGDVILYDRTNSFTMTINKLSVTIIQLREVVGVF
jgi:chaperonin GroES|tara:strand:+ start:168 stop:425 length:258 start_codon:yes stop_codon:yes gene_type:complete